MKKMALVFGLLVVVAIATPLLAVPIPVSIDFSGSTGGTLTINSPNVSGTGIVIDRMTVLSVDSITSAVTFTTYAVVGGDLEFNTAPASFITVTGAIPSLAGLGSSVTLLSGSFSSWTVGNGLVTGAGPDTKNATLLSDLGFASGTKFEFYGFSTGIGNLIPGHPNQYVANSTDISNSVVPEPASLLLIGTGLLGIFTWARRK
jgi:hypothetical protein